MKLRTSFFDSAVLKKALLRFWPAWVLYFIGALLVAHSNTGNTTSLVRSLSGGALLTIFNAVYGALIVMLLFGDLFKSRMCNALHALPVRREAWFVSHTVAGILMGVGPNLVISLTLIPFCGQFWYIPLLWAAMMSMQYLFFFGTATLSIYLTGNGFAAALVYGLFNFCSLLVMWFVGLFYVPLLYGLKLNDNAFLKFSPLSYSLDNQEAWDVEHLDTCANPACKQGESWRYHPDCLYEVTFDRSLWVYFAIMAALGVVFLLIALLLYRKRKLECAGDFAAVKPMKTVFTVLMSIAAGMVFYMFVEELYLFGYIMLLLGGIVGFFVCQMLLQRTAKVFSKQNWGKLGILVVAVALSMVLTAVDVFGITQIVPDADDVVSVTLADSHISQPINLNTNSSSLGGARGVDPGYMYGNLGYVTLTEPEHIQKAIDIHNLLLQEGPPPSDYNHYYTPITIYYCLKNGTTLTRYYYGYIQGEAAKKLREFTNTPVYILGINQADELLKDLRYVNYSGEQFYADVEDELWQQKLAEALYQDAQDGNLYQSFVGGNKSYVEFSYERDGRFKYLSLMIPATAEHTLQWEADYYAWLKENGKVRN